MSKMEILVVEDEAIVAEDLKGKLQRLGYDIAGVAAEGEEAISMADRLRPNLVLMDIQLAGEMDGIEAAEVIGREHSIPVLYLTAHSDPATLARAKLTTPIGYILKPFEERELAIQIEMALYRHKVDRKIREQREWLQVIFNSIGDAVIATDSECRVTFFNPVAEALTGWNSREAAGKPLMQTFSLIDAQTRRPVEGPVAKVLREGRRLAVHNHTELVTKSGHTVPIEHTAAPILDTADRLTGVVLVFRDITQKKKAEEQLRQTQKMEAIGRLSAGVAHEFNNMLNVIHGNAELMRFHLEEDSPLQKYLREITEAAQRSAKLSDQLGAYSSGRPGAPEAVDLSQEIGARLPMLEALSGNVIRIHFNPESSVWPIRIDPDQLSQVLVHLASNAADAISEQGEITIAVQNVRFDQSDLAMDLEAGDYVKLSFADNGAGMDSQTRERIFDPFFTTKEVGRGTGLGLSSVAGIIKQNKGGLAVESEPGKGTRFHIYFPRAI